MKGTRMLEVLTLDAIRAESIALDLRMIRGKSPFDTTLSGLMRLAALSDQLSVVFKEATAQLGENATADLVALSKNLITLAALAAIWAEILDKNSRCRCVITTAIDSSTVTRTPGANQCPVHPLIAVWEE